MRGDTRQAGEPRGQRPLLKRRGLWPAIGLSLLAHLIVLTAIGIVRPRPVYRNNTAPPTLTVQLMPRISRIRTHTPTATAAALTRTTATADPLPSPLHPHLPPPSPALPPAPSTLSASAAPGAGAGGRIGAGDAPGPFPYEDSQYGVRAMLRATVGCSNEEATHLTTAEREDCAQRFGREAKKATPFIGIDPAKRAGYDAALQADADRRDGTKAQASLKALQDARGITGRPDVKFDVTGGFNCTIKFGFGSSSKPSCHGSPPSPISPPN